MAEKKRNKLADFVEVLIPKGKDSSGRTVFEPSVIARGNMSDAEWSRTKAAVRGSMGTGAGSDVAIDEPYVAPDERPAPKKSRALGGIVAGSGGGSAIVPLKSVEVPADRDARVKAEMDRVQRENPTFVYSDPKEIAPGVTEEMRDMSGAEQMAAGGRAVMGADAGTSAPMSEEDAIRFMDASPKQVVQPNVQVVQPQERPTTTAVPPGALEETVTDIPVMEQMAMGAREVGKTLSDPEAWKQAGKDALTRMVPGGQAAVDAVSSLTPNNARKAGAEMLGRSPGAQFAELVEQGRQSVQNMPMGQQPAAVPGQPPTAGSASMRMSGTGGPVRTGAPAVSEYDKALKEGQDALRMQADAESQAAQMRIAARADTLKKQEALAAEEKAAQMRLREEENKLNAAYQSTLDEVTQRMKLDPSHFWNSRSDGQKAMTVIGAFLAGIGGKDPAGTINQLVQRDLSVQRENYEMAREAGKMKLAGIDNMYGRLRQRGLDERQAFSAAKAAMTEGLAMQMDDIADRVADPVAKAKAQMASANLRMTVAKAKEDAAMGAAQRAHMANQDAIAKFEAGVRASQTAQQAKEESPGTRSEVAKIDLALQAADRLLAQVEGTGIGQQVIDTQVQAIRGLLPQSMERVFDQVFPSVRERELAAGEVGRSVKKAVAGEALSTSEAEEAERRMPRPGLTQKNTAALKELRQQLVDKRKSLMGSRFDVGPMPSAPLDFQAGK